MVSKVELDLLEEIDVQSSEGPSEEKPGKQGSIRRVIKRITGKKLAISALLLATAGLVVISWQFFSPAKHSGMNRGLEIAEVRPINGTVENLNNFLVDIRDDHGRYRVLVCDIVIAMQPDKKVSGNMSELRKKAYNTLKNKGAYVLTSSNAYGTIKKEVQDELNGFLGGGIKEIYFTKFMIL